MSDIREHSPQVHRWPPPALYTSALRASRSDSFGSPVRHVVVGRVGTPPKSYDWSRNIENVGGGAGTTPTTIIPPTLRGRGEHARQGCGVRGAVEGEGMVVFQTRE